MKTKYLIPVLGCILLQACTPVIVTSRSNIPPLKENDEVLVLGLTDLKPEHSVNLGEVKIASAGSVTNCTYDAVLEMAKKEARKNGGNVLKIVEHKVPTADNKCHSIRALILKIDDLKNYKPIEEEIIQNADYAILKVFMPSKVGALVKYDVLLGDLVICNVKNNYRSIIYIKKEGQDTLRASLEALKELPINIKFGRTYYVRCGVNASLFAPQPELDLIDSQTGEEEFETINAEIQ